MGSPDTLRESETTDEVAMEVAPAPTMAPTDGAAAAGQSAPPPPEDMEADPPKRLLRIKKKPKPGFVPLAGATAVTAGSDPRASASPVAKKHTPLANPARRGPKRTPRMSRAPRNVSPRRRRACSIWHTRFRASSNGTPKHCYQWLLRTRSSSAKKRFKARNRR